MAVLTLTEVRDHLDITSVSHDVELTTFIGRAEAALAEKVGPLEPTAVTERVSGGRVLVLSKTPVVSLTSVAEVGGTALDVAGLYADLSAGVVEFNDGCRFTARRYTVTYQAGRTTLPEDLKLAALELLRHLWGSQRGGAPTSGGALPNQGDAEFVAPEASAAFTFPWRVEQLISPHLQVSI